MHHVAPEIVSIADVCLGGLRGRSVLLIGPQEARAPLAHLLHQAHMNDIYEEDTPAQLSSLVPHTQLIISVLTGQEPSGQAAISAANIAQSCSGRHTPLLILDLANPASVEELAGLLPAVCLYTPTDLRKMLEQKEKKAS